MGHPQQCVGSPAHRRGREWYNAYEPRNRTPPLHPVSKCHNCQIRLASTGMVVMRILSVGGSMNLLRCAAIALVGLLVIPLAGVDAGTEKVAFPANYKSGVLYNVVDRDDLKEVHQQYTSREAIEAAQAGKPLPAGTVIASA